MIAPAWRGTDLFTRLGEVSAAFTADRDVRVVFGACEPHLISFYARHQRPYGAHNINSAESGYLIPLVCFLGDPEELADVCGGRTPSIVDEVLGRTGTVTSPSFLGADRYLEEALAAISAANAPAFGGLTCDETVACLRGSNIIDIRGGDVVLKSGGSARNVFVLLDGELDVTRDGRWVGSIHTGELVGEMAYLLEATRGSDVTAKTDGRILSLSERTLRALPDDQPTVAAQLHRNMARQLSTRLQLAETWSGIPLDHPG
jgi:hypothetical protein